MAKKKTAPDEAQKDGEGELRKARVLTRIYADGNPVEPDTVIEMPATELAHYVEAGSVDPHPDAVAYAESLDG